MQGSVDERFTSGALPMAQAVAACRKVQKCRPHRVEARRPGAARSKPDPLRGAARKGRRRNFNTDAQALRRTAPHPLVFIPSGRLAARLFGMATMRPPNLIHLDRPVQSVRLQKTLADEVRP